MIDMLQQSLRDMVHYSGQGIVAIDLIDRETALSVSGIRSNPVACATFNKLLDDLQAASARSGLMEAVDMLVLSEQGAEPGRPGHNVIVVVTLSRRYRLGMKVDTTRCSLGMLLGVVFVDKLPTVKACLPVK